MQQICIALFVVFATTFAGMSQSGTTVNRSQLTIMVVPHNTRQKVHALDLLESQHGYLDAIALINTALLNMGYKQVRDFSTHMEVVNKRRVFTSDVSATDRMKIYIEEAPVDMLIEAEIVYTDPPGKPTGRQARILLKAVDKYTSSVYANSAVQSYEREFSGLAQAVEHALKKDGAAAFNAFLQQLDTQYAGLLADGRPMQVKFEVAPNCTMNLTDRIGMERLSDKIMQCIKYCAYKGQYKVTGESKLFLDFTAQVPVIDDKGNSVTPSDYLRYKVDQYLFGQGFETDYSTMGTWINFVVRKKN